MRHFQGTYEIGYSRSCNEFKRQPLGLKARSYNHELVAGNPTGQIHFVAFRNT